MTQTTQIDFNATYQRIVSLLDQEVSSSSRVIEREVRRAQLETEINLLSAEVSKVQYRFRRLPMLPPAHLIEWAEAVLQLPNLTFVVLETTGVNDDADIIRFYVADPEGQTLFDRLTQPQRYRWSNPDFTGLTWERDLSAAPPLTEVWEDFRAALTGRYVLAFNLSFVADRLRDNAAHYQELPITLIGDDLQDRCRQYWDSHYNVKLTTLCDHIAYPLPSPALAPDRAKAQLALLHAMAAGITNVQREEPVELEGDGYEDGPF